MGALVEPICLLFRACCPPPGVGRATGGRAGPGRRGDPGRDSRRRASRASPRLHPVGGDRHLQLRLHRRGAGLHGPGRRDHLGASGRDRRGRRPTTTNAPAGRARRSPAPWAPSAPGRSCTWRSARPSTPPASRKRPSRRRSTAAAPASGTLRRWRRGLGRADHLRSGRRVAGLPADRRRRRRRPFRELRHFVPPANAGENAQPVTAQGISGQGGFAGTQTARRRRASRPRQLSSRVLSGSPGTAGSLGQGG